MSPSSHFYAFSTSQNNLLMYILVTHIFKLIGTLNFVKHRIQNYLSMEYRISLNNKEYNLL